ncbi:uncharacterized protein LOC130898567 [Diorhabda carinulata]|uniref:uncharacterized protein LOC130898567 n=1 Tax=Diorhabda carinulata TaxID=1163345 RepID=UPI0025A14E3C|nr:uncharacterized protein LOC130898567 [Diorhabda carinulata]
MALSTTQKICGRLAGILGTLQGLTWASLSLTSIIMYYENDNDGTNTTYSLNNGLYEYYLDKASNEPWRTIRSSDFIILMWIYFFISVAWSTISLDLFLAIKYNKTRYTFLKITWGILTIAISVIDLVLTALLLRDYLNCQNNNETEYDELICHTVIGTVMCLASRGFVLWIMNATLAISEIVSGIKIVSGRQIVNGRSDITIPRAKLDRGQDGGSLDLNTRFSSFPTGNQTPPVNSFNQREYRY